MYKHEYENENLRPKHTVRSYITRSCLFPPCHRYKPLYVCGGKRFPYINYEPYICIIERFLLISPSANDPVTGITRIVNTGYWIWRLRMEIFRNNYVLRNGFFCRNQAEEDIKKPQYRLECANFAWVVFFSVQSDTVFTHIFLVSN